MNGDMLFYFLGSIVGSALSCLVIYSIFKWLIFERFKTNISLLGTFIISAIIVTSLVIFTYDKSDYITSFLIRMPFLIIYYIYDLVKFRVKKVPQ